MFFPRFIFLQDWNNFIKIIPRRPAQLKLFKLFTFGKKSIIIWQADLQQDWLFVHV